MRRFIRYLCIGYTGDILCVMCRLVVALTRDWVINFWLSIWQTFNLIPLLLIIWHIVILSICFFCITPCHWIQMTLFCTRNTPPILSPAYRTPVYATTPPRHPLYPPNRPDPGIKGSHQTVLFPFCYLLYFVYCIYQCISLHMLLYLQGGSKK